MARRTTLYGVARRMLPVMKWNHTSRLETRESNVNPGSLRPRICCGSLPCAIHCPGGGVTVVGIGRSQRYWLSRARAGSRDMGQTKSNWGCSAWPSQHLGCRTRRTSLTARLLQRTRPKVRGGGRYADCEPAAFNTQGGSGQLRQRQISLKAPLPTPRDPVHMTLQITVAAFRVQE